LFVFRQSNIEGKECLSWQYSDRRSPEKSVMATEGERKKERKKGNYE
jgi:hypothetical protein